MEVPLLEQPPRPSKAQKEEKEEENQHSNVKTSSLLLGLMVGFFLQISTLGANYLAITLWGKDVMNTSKAADYYLFSLLWCLFLTCMALAILAFLRNLIIQAPSNNNNITSSDYNLDTIIFCRFVVGALMGVCSAWAATDYFLLGMMSLQIVYSVGTTLTVALLWCGVMMWVFASRRSRH